MEPFHIVLFEPEIPQNTGTIGRLAVSTGAKLHLIEPLGFSLEDKYLKRAGLDYWPHLAPARYRNWQEFLDTMQPERMFFISSTVYTLVQAWMRFFLTSRSIPISRGRATLGVTAL